jgi:hypothetical protein
MCVGNGKAGECVSLDMGEEKGWKRRGKVGLGQNIGIDMLLIVNARG